MSPIREFPFCRLSSTTCQMQFFIPSFSSFFPSLPFHKAGRVYEREEGRRNEKRTGEKINRSKGGINKGIENERKKRKERFNERKDMMDEGREGGIDG